MKRYIIILGVLLISNVTALLAQEFLVEEDLRLNWVFHDEGEQLMLPFLDNSSDRPFAIHLTIENNYGNEAYLRLSIPAKTSLLIENKFISNFQDEKVKYFLVDSLLQNFGVESLNLTLYNKIGFESPTDTKIGFIHKTFNSRMNVNPINQRDLDGKNDYLKIIILLVFTFFVVLYALFPSDLFEFLSIQNLFTFRFTETAFIKYRTLTKTQTLVIAYQAALMASILIVFLNYFYNPFGQTFLTRINPVLSWLVIFVLILILIFFKYILISIISTLFKVPDKINFYFVEFLRMAMIFYSIVFIVLSFTVINQFYLVGLLFENLIAVVISFNIIRFIFLYFKFRRTVSMKSLHLFSYLCTTELIPIVLGLKFFLK